MASCARGSEAIDPIVSGGEHTEEGSPTSDTGNDDSDSESSEIGAPDVVSLDPFKGVEIMVSGISPYCTVTINNQNCDPDVQKNVEYSLDKTMYANGDTVTITAQLNVFQYAHNTQEFRLNATTHTYTVEGQPEYLTSLKDADLTMLKSELADYISAGKANVVVTSGGYYNHLFSLFVSDTGYDATTIMSCDSTKLNSTYFSSLKPTKLTNFSLGYTHFNQISFIYEMDYSWLYLSSDSGTGTAWFNISACNLVKYPDGSVKWGNYSIGAYDFNCEHSTQGGEACITSTVTVDSINYNISKVD